MNRFGILIITIGITYGQQATPQAVAPSITLKRQPPPVTAARPGITDPHLYPVGQIVVGLQPGDSPQTTAVPTAPDTTASPSSPTKDVPLSASASEALALGKNWMTEKHVPAPGKDGRVLYTFGAGLPTIVCAPLRVCVLELEPGEKMVGEPHIGDSVRWTISPAAAGRPEAQMIVIKPKQAGLDTNLLVTTDRRAYYIRLVSKPEDYLARVAFAYPDDATAEWQQHFQQEEEQRRKQEAESAQIAPLDSIENLYFNYRISGGDEYLRPVRVVDDGRKTFVQMAPGASVRETPVLVVVGPNGPEMVNYRVKGDMYIVDRLFERGALILGLGKKQRRADIVRGSYRGKDAGKLLRHAVTETPPSPPEGDAPRLPPPPPQPSVEDRRRELALQREQEAMDAPTTARDGYSRDNAGGVNSSATPAAQGEGGQINQLLQALQGTAVKAGIAAPRSVSLSGQPPSAAEEYKIQNSQDEKEEFLDKARARDQETYLGKTRARPLGKFEIKAGWDIPAVLEQALNSDLPGDIKALVRENVYDTATGKYLLIPQGSRLVGNYSSRISYGQNGIQVVWDRIIFPDGSSIVLDGMSGEDAKGTAGLRDQVDNHYGRLIGMGALTSLFAAAGQLTVNRRSNVFSYPSAQELAGQSVAQNMSQIGAEATRRNLNVQPTIKVAVGYRFNVRVNRDILFEEPYQRYRL